VNLAFTLVGFLMVVGVAAVEQDTQSGLLYWVEVQVTFGFLK